MTAFLLRLCAADRCSRLISHEYRHLTQAHRARARAVRLRRLRAPGAPSTVSVHRRSSHSPRSLLKRPAMTSSQHELRRRSSAADRSAPIAPAAATTSIAMATTLAETADMAGARHEGSKPGSKTPTSGSGTETMPPPPPLSPQQTKPQQQEQEAQQQKPRPSRSDSASRSTNRLALILPIAPPTSDASRPTPMSASSSVPPTPVEASTTTSPSDASDFIIAIAAQERRVLELREELARAEADLTSLKTQWTAREPYDKRRGSHDADSRRRAAAPGTLDDDSVIASRRSLELDRRKLLLQKQGQSTPAQSRRRVLRGGHTRALSLLSPARTDAELGADEDDGQGLSDRTATQPARGALPKRASWQPRSVQNSPGVPQIVEDLKLGLRAFVEDIRQITVGDEPIRGRGTPTPQQQQQQQHVGEATSRGMPGDGGRLRTGHSALLETGAATPTPAPRSAGPFVGAVLEKPKPTKSRHYSWKPLGLDSLDDNGWSNWESPGLVKSPRWSGSTMGSAEGIGSIPEVGEESITPVYVWWHEWHTWCVPWGDKSRVYRKPKPAAAETPQRRARLEEMLPSVVNRLSPSNLKRTANSLMEECEKSLVAEPGDKENKALGALDMDGLAGDW